jgi:BirA family biotin operon repressor/biotin-[acetyl-CoA-carboxylase] ligase
MPRLSHFDAPADGMESDAVFSHAPVDDALLAHHLHGVALDRELVMETTSTNADLVSRARTGAPARPVLRVTRRQTQGRGRQGRRWHGSENGSLLFSLAVPWQRDPAGSSAVTLACGLAVAAALHEQLDPVRARIRVKWPNDILLNDGKLAGILVEMAEDPSGARTLVIGVGINLAADAGLLARVAQDRPGAQGANGDAAAAAVAVADLASVLGAAAVLAEREAWLARLVRALLAAAQRFGREGFAGGPAAFAACCAYDGLAVDVHGAGGPPTTGILRGVDAQGRLLLETQGVLQAVNSGEVSLRRNPTARPPGHAGGAP